ncbi:general substrate transporter [Penicillium cf. viridicatum]|uniref:General substrate transporter n=1 Tax=Penicillium cf. viridicatum TaxID=2972119 RepID=A0A9W9JCE7_9EURO|nr:general substrate transporter [Penicillium cf. viridicatum]
MMDGLQAVESWRNYFGQPKGATLGLFNAAYPTGGLVAIPFISFVCDGFGRRAGLALGAIICCIGAALQSGAQNLEMFVIARGILGCGTVFLRASGSPLITEIAHPAHRPTATAMFNTTYSLGAIFAAWTTFGTFRIDGSAAWRIPSALQGLPSLVQLLGLYFVPESPRWLVSKYRSNEALEILAKYHAEGNQADPLVHFEFNDIQEALEYERSVGLTSSLEQTLINATQQMLSWFSSLYFATLPNKIGRRFIFLGSGMCIFFCLVGITTGSAMFAQDASNKAAGGVVVAFLYLFSPCYNFGLNGNLGLYIAETLPFHLRMRGQALYHLFSTSLTLLVTYAFPIGLQGIKWKFYIIFIPWVAIEFVVVYFVYPETKGYSLEEIAVIFDGESAASLRNDLSADSKDLDVEHSEIVSK